jgi:RNA polymerase sigma-70 factor (ECF subfamily)
MADATDRVEALYLCHGRALLGYLGRWFGRAEAAEDLLHETFVQALQGTDRLNEAASPRAWLFGIARRVGLRALRRRRMETRAARRIAEASAAPARPEDDRLDRLRRAVGALAPAHREPLELRLLEDLSYEEIADVLGLPVGTVRSRLHHAVRRLRETLAGGEGAGPVDGGGAV